MKGELRKAILLFLFLIAFLELLKRCFILLKSRIILLKSRFVLPKSRFVKIFLDFRKIKQRKNQGGFAIEEKEVKIHKKRI